MFCFTDKGQRLIVGVQDVGCMLGLAVSVLVNVLIICSDHCVVFLLSVCMVCACERSQFQPFLSLLSGTVDILSTPGTLPFKHIFIMTRDYIQLFVALSVDLRKTINQTQCLMGKHSRESELVIEIH